MIKFFRKIRQRMLSENKFSKYLLYATGEIFLVVIGILLAVQINDWNEANKIERTNRIHLEKMVAELEEDKARMLRLTTNPLEIPSFGYPDLQEAIDNCDSLLRRSFHGLDESDIPFITQGRFFAGRSTLNIHQDVFDELKNTGRLNSLGSDELVSDIKAYYSRCDREKGYLVGHNGLMNIELERLKVGFGKLIGDHRFMPAQFDLANYPWFGDKRSREYQDMQIAFTDILRYQQENFVKMMEIYTLADSLVLDITEELEQIDR
jgi:hypothetical protein